MELPIRRLAGDLLRIPIRVGEQIFVVGANGSGKSALFQHIVTSVQSDKIRRISAHRQTWFSSGNLEFTARSRRQFETNSVSLDRRADARWMDHSPEEKQSAVLFDLVAKDNARYRSIGQFIDEQRPTDATEFASKSEPLFRQLNDLLDLGTLTVSLRNSNDEEILAHHRDGGKSFSIAQMSDGERAAVIMAANVLTVGPGTVLLIDEPERHLHRSIIEPFLSALFAKRRDCAFVISTHEIALPVANPKARILLVRSCEWRDQTAQAWDVEVLESNMSLPEDLKRDILGSRRQILFVEGTSNSLDLPLYTTLFPRISVIPKGTCNDVIRAVKGLRGARDHHHIEAFGLIDRDDRTEDEVKGLAQDNVFALRVCSAESLYYCADAIAAVARSQAESLERDPDEMIQRATRRALKIVKRSDLCERMAARRCERRVRKLIEIVAPDWRMIKESGNKLHVSSTVDSPYADELAQFRRLASAGDLDGLIARYPLQESNIFDKLAETLECKNKGNYERMVVSQVRKDDGLRGKLIGRINPLSKLLDPEPVHAN